MTLWIDLILALVALEAAVLLLWRRLHGGAVPAATLIPNLLAGAMLLLSMRVALAGGGLLWTGPCLFAALLAHLADLRSRWEQPPIKRT